MAVGREKLLVWIPTSGNLPLHANLSSDGHVNLILIVVFRSIPEI